MTTDTQFIITLILLLGGILYVSAMAIYRKISGGEQFDLQKYGQTFGYVAIVAVGAFIATGVLPNFDEILTQVLSVPLPSINELLILATAVFTGIVQKVYKIQVAKKEDAVATPAQPAPGTIPGQNAGKGKVLGIYGGSAKGSLPQQTLVIDVNMVPTLFFDVSVLAAGPIAMQLIIDGIIQKKWLPDTGSDDGVVTAKFMQEQVGLSLPYAFQLASNFRTPGEHSVAIRLGYFDTVGKISGWFSLDTYKITLTGIVFQE
jgi:hypothetical protein